VSASSQEHSYTGGWRAQRRKPASPGVTRGAASHNRRACRARPPHPSMTPAGRRLRVRLGFLHPQRFLGRKNAPMPPSLLREADRRPPAIWRQQPGKPQQLQGCKQARGLERIG